MIKSKNIELFRNLAQYKFDMEYFDFHNDYDCLKILLLSENILVLIFKNITNRSIVKLKFLDVTICALDFFNFQKVENLTIDNLYRGKIQIDKKLVELRNRKHGYFYLEFDEGQKLEFWSIGVDIEN